MLKPMLRAAALLAVALIPPASASAADDDAKIVESLPPEVADVVTGGSWSEGKQGGFYRAIVIMSGNEQILRGARLSCSGLRCPKPNPVPKMVATVPLKEVNDQKLGNASIEIEGEESKDNEITIIVSSYDFDADKDISLYVKGTAPGKYAMSKAPAKRPAAAAGCGPDQCPQG